MLIIYFSSLRTNSFWALSFKLVICAHAHSVLAKLVLQATVWIRHTVVWHQASYSSSLFLLRLRPNGVSPDDARCCFCHVFLVKL